MKLLGKRSVATVSVLLAHCAFAQAQQSVDDLSKAAANPLAPIISVPITQDFDFRGGNKSDGFSYLVEAEPVIPFQLSDEWNLISRTIIPVAYDNYVAGQRKAGLGDITASFFLSPTAPGPGGIMWGVGPALLLPTATEPYLGGGKWGAGPTGVALIQKDAWTAGALVSHIWSFAGKADRQDISVTQLEPFVSYDFGDGLSLNFTVESTYDWNERQWTVPLNLTASKIVTIGAQAVSLEFGGRYYAEAPQGGPDWGLRAGVTLFFQE